MTKIFIYPLLLLFSLNTFCQISLVEGNCNNSSLNYGYRFIPTSNGLFYNNIDCGMYVTDGNRPGSFAASVGTDPYPFRSGVIGNYIYIGQPNLLLRVNITTGTVETVKSTDLNSTPGGFMAFNGLVLFTDNGGGLWRSDG